MARGYCFRLGARGLADESATNGMKFLKWQLSSEAAKGVDRQRRNQVRKVQMKASRDWDARCISSTLLLSRACPCLPELPVSDKTVL